MESSDVHPEARHFAVSALALAAYSVFLLDFTYLDPLPWRAGQLGVVLLLVAALGAGLLSGWHWRTVLLLAACGVGLLVPSPSLMEESKRWTTRLFEGAGHGPKTDDVLFLLLLAPLAILLGALLSRLSDRTRLGGFVVLAVPLAVIAWTGVRHARPIDVHPAVPITISYPSYRGVALRDKLPKVLGVLGKPDRRASDVSFVYGRDTFQLTPPDLVSSDVPEARYVLVTVDVEDPSAETPEGVGIGDSLSLVASRLRARGHYCFHDSDAFEPYCTVYFDSNGHETITFVGDPIARIEIG